MGAVHVPEPPENIVPIIGLGITELDAEDAVELPATLVATTVKL
jgi:hypothetical protein